MLKVGQDLEQRIQSGEISRPPTDRFKHIDIAKPEKLISIVQRSILVLMQKMATVGIWISRQKLIDECFDKANDDDTNNEYRDST